MSNKTPMEETKKENKVINTIMKEVLGCCIKVPVTDGHKIIDAHNKIRDILKEAIIEAYEHGEINAENIYKGNYNESGEQYYNTKYKSNGE